MMKFGTSAQKRGSSPFPFERKGGNGRKTAGREEGYRSTVVVHAHTFTHKPFEDKNNEDRNGRNGRGNGKAGKGKENQKEAGEETEERGEMGEEKTAERACGRKGDRPPPT